MADLLRKGVGREAEAGVRSRVLSGVQNLTIHLCGIAHAALLRELSYRISV